MSCLYFASWFVYSFDYTLYSCSLNILSFTPLFCLSHLHILYVFRNSCNCDIYHTYKPPLQYNVTYCTVLYCTIQVFKVLALNCLVSAYMMSALYLRGLKQGDMQMTSSGLITAGLFFFLSQVRCD
jgi:hypothetical protein